MKNLKEAKELLEKYKSITLEELEQKYKIFASRHFHFKEGKRVMQSITRFGTSHCILCIGVNSVCSNCIYSFRDEKPVLSCMDIIYKEMEDATSAEELFNAIQKRISYLTHVIEWYETRK
jgi:hypothetical protein